MKCWPFLWPLLSLGEAYLGQREARCKKKSSKLIEKRVLPPRLVPHQWQEKKSVIFIDTNLICVKYYSPHSAPEQSLPLLNSYSLRPSGCQGQRPLDPGPCWEDLPTGMTFPGQCVYKVTFIRSFTSQAWTTSLFFLKESPYLQGNSSSLIQNCFQRNVPECHIKEMSSSTQETANKLRSRQPLRYFRNKEFAQVRKLWVGGWAEEDRQRI